MPRWRARPVLSGALRAIVILVPVVLAIGAAFTLANVLPDPSGAAATLAWWLAIITVTIATVVVARRAARRLLPLGVLYRLSLVFPDHAPSRFKLAARAWSTRRLGRLVAEARESGVGSNDATAAAELLVTMIAALGNHDARTRGHSERTRAYADLLADEMGLSDDDRDRLRWAALLHDVGKLAVSPAILGKDGKPDDAEWAELRRHPDLGYELARPLHPFLGGYAETILHHHERIDGSGYPRGLVGEEINLGARIVAVADAFDAMTASRSYQPPRHPDVARRELAYRAGTQFDAAVVRALLNISIGRIRWVMGPLAVLGAIPAMGSFRQLGSAAGTVGTVAASLVVLATIGPFTSPTAPAPAPAAVLGVEQAAPGIVVDVATAPDADPASVAIAAAPGFGVATAGDDGTIVFVAPPDAEGTASISYRVCTYDGRCKVGLLEVEMAPGRPPELGAAPPGVVQLVPGDVPSALGRELPAATTTTTTAPTTTTTAPTTTATSSTTTTTLALATVPPPSSTVAAPTPTAPATTTTTTTTTPPTTTTTTTTATAPPSTTTTVTTVPTSTTTTTAPTTTTTAPPPTTTTTTAPTSTTTTTTTAPPPTTTTTTAPTSTTTTTTTAPPPTTTTTTTTTSPPSGPGDPPRAEDDDATVAEDGFVVIDVLVNDRADDLASLRIVIDKAPDDGTAEVVAGAILYTPAPDFNGNDHFRYEICDPFDQCDKAQVRVTVTPVNDPPAAQDDAGEARLDRQLRVDVLANDDDPDGDRLTITAVSDSSVLGGTVVILGTDVGYLPPLGWTGEPDSFTYTVSDGNGGTDTATVRITLLS